MTYLRYIINLIDHMNGSVQTMIHSNSYLVKSSLEGSLLILHVLSDETRTKVPLEISKALPGEEVPHPFLHGLVDVVKCDLKNGDGLKDYALFVPKKQLTRFH